MLGQPAGVWGENPIEKDGLVGVGCRGRIYRSSSRRHARHAGLDRCVCFDIYMSSAMSSETKPLLRAGGVPMDSQQQQQKLSHPRRIPVVPSLFPPLFAPLFPPLFAEPKPAAPASKPTEATCEGGDGREHCVRERKVAAGSK